MPSIGAGTMGAAGAAVATDLARRAAEQHITRHGGTLIEGCGGRVEHRGQLLAERFKAK